MTPIPQVHADYEVAIAPAREKYQKQLAAALAGDTQSLTYLWQADEEYHAALDKANAEYKRSQMKEGE